MAARDLPSVRSLVALDAFARCGTVRAAAQELGVRASTVSRQLSELEGELGHRILSVNGRTLQLTDAGREFARRLSNSLLLAEGAWQILREDLTSPDRGKHLIKLLLPDALAVHWMPERLAKWRSMHPEIKVQIRTQVHMPDWETLDFDMALTMSSSQSELIVSEFIAPDETTLAVSTPVAGKLNARSIRVWELFERCPLLVSHANSVRTEHWLKENGLREASQQQHLQASSMLTAMEQALNGAGTIIGSRLLFSDLLEERALTEPWPARRAWQHGWWICTKASSGQYSCMHEFAAFLAGEIRHALGPAA